MAIYHSFVNGGNNDGLGDLRVLLDGSIIGGSEVNNSVTYGNDTFLPGITVTLSGTISGSPSSSWLINTIVAYDGSVKLWEIDSIGNVVNGAQLTDPFNKHSLFQAEFYRGAPRLIFGGDSNDLFGGPGNQGLFGFGTEGFGATINAGKGHDIINAGGGISSVFLQKNGHALVEFSTLDDSDQSGNYAIVHNFSTARDVILINSLTFTHLKGTPTLLPSLFHIGPNHPHNGSEQVWYNPHTGQLWVDFHSNTFGEVKAELAVLDGPGHTHPHLTAGDIIYA